MEESISEPSEPGEPRGPQELQEPEIPTLDRAAPPRASIHVEYDQRVNFAMQQNDVPIVKLLRVTNLTSEELKDVIVGVWIDSNLAPVWQREIASIGAGATYNLSRVDLALDARVLVHQTEREVSQLHVEVTEGSRIIASATLPIEVLAFNEWGGIGSLPEILAAFVMPNHPAIDGVLASARVHLERVTGQPALSGYQSRSVAHVRQIVAAIYAALLDCDLGYIAPPASYERQGQKVRPPDQLLEHRLGTCLDLALLLAACFEQAGLNPLVIIIEGHAFVGVWTNDETFPEAATDDASRIRKRVQLGEIIAIEATALTTRPALSLPDAERAALRHLLEEKAFHCAVDIRSARRMRVRPLTLRVAAGTFDVVDETGERGAATVPQTAATVEATSTVSAAESIATSAGSADQEHEPSHARLDRWKRKLLDLSNRNRLINFRDSNKSVPLVCPDLAAVEDALIGGLNFSIFHRPALMDEQNPRSAEVGEQRTGENVLNEYLRDELASRRLYSPLTEPVLQRRLIEIFRAARLSVEESGANTLYLAVGFLAWYESTAEGAERRVAPILLLPLTLERKSAREGFHIALGDEEPRLNVTLLEKLRVEFGVDITGLDEAVEDEHGLDVPQILQRFRKAIRDIPRWDVIEEAHLGLFSFTKFLMWLDLQDRATTLMRNPVVRYLVERPETPFESDAEPLDPTTLDIARHPKDTFCPLDADSSQLSAVFAAEDGRSFVLEGPPGTGKSQTITNLIAQCLTHGKRVLFVAEKMAALNVVHTRLDRIGLGPFCLELHSNKSSKREVLDQLQESLDVVRAGLPADWEPHSNELAASRKELNELVRVLHEPRPIGRSVYQVTSSLIGLRESPRVPFDAGWVQSLDAARVTALREILDRVATAGEVVGDPTAHPYRAVEREQWLTTLPAQVTQAVAAVVKTAGTFEQAINDALRELRLGATPAADELSGRGIRWLKTICDLFIEQPRPTPALLNDPAWSDLRASLIAMIDAGRKRDAMRTQLRARYRDSLLAENLDDLLARMRSGMTGFFFTAWLKRRGVRKTVAAHATGSLPDHQTVIADLELAIQRREQEKLVAGYGESAQRAFGTQWNNGEADWDKLDAVITWTDRFRTHLISAAGRELTADAAFRSRAIELATALRDHVAPEAALGTALRRFLAELTGFNQSRDALAELLVVNRALAWDDTAARYLPTVRQVATSWEQHLRSLPDWCHWRRSRRAAIDAGLLPLVAAYESRSIAGPLLQQTFNRSVGQVWLSSVTDSTELLRTFNSREHERRIAKFGKLDREQLDLTRQYLKARFASQVPKVHGEASGASEMGILQRQLKLQRRHMPLRKLIQKLPNLLPRLKPCLLMSPLSVAQYLDASFPPFDVVVFDEASQIPVWDAVGAIARGTQVIVVGDSKQLPPTNFFMKVDDEEALPDEDDFEEMESILDECSASGLRSLRLLWHYRSRHESLITFSNYHYYDNRLQTFPSPQERSAERGVSLRHLPGGVYDRGDTRTNAAEAEAIVADVVARLTATEPEGGKKKSIGIVTFSIPQQVLIEDMLDAARRKHPAIEPYFTSAVPEPVFIKNLENVQGDERDVILFSICYGPDKTGKVAMAFGPLNRQGGERRLNVAVTRAREQVVVFSTLRAEQIDLSRTSALAVAHLKTFLDYAERGPAAIAEAVAVTKDASAVEGLEKDVAAKLLERGWKTESRVGCSGFRIDLAVRDPDKPDQFILGIVCDGPFYASAPTARDRDRSRQSVLTGLGWTLHRLWSSDWWLDPQREMERIEAAIGEALKARAAADRAASAAKLASPVSQADGAVSGDIASAVVAPVDSQPATAADVAPSEEEIEDDPTPGMKTYRAVLPEKPYGDTESFYAPKSRRQIRDLLLRVVKREAPIQWDLALKRICTFWSFARATQRAENLIREILSIIPEPERPRLIDGVLWRAGDDPTLHSAFRVPGDEDDLPRKADEIPPVEFANAAAMVLEQQIGLPMEALVREVARLFGFVRVTPKVQPSVEAGIAVLAARNGCVVKDGLVTLPR